MPSDAKLIQLTEAVVIIAARSAHGAIRGTEVCKQLGLPERYLEPEFQNLVRAGILKSIRGPKGGYVLAREKRNINMHDVSKALSREKDESKLSQLATDVILKKLSAVDNALSSITLYDIMQDAAGLGIKTVESNADFTI